MAFRDLSLDEMHELLIAVHKTHHPDIDVSEMSDAWLDLRTLAAAVTDNNAHINAVKKDLLPWSATGETQEEWGRFSGLAKKSATPARKAAALRIVGTPATPVPDGIELTHVSGLRFRTFGSSVVGANRYVDVGIVGIDVGSRTRLRKGEVLTFASPIAGLEEEAELQRDMDEDGEDAETEAAYGARIAARWSTPPLGGAQADYVQWATAVTGIAAAYAYPLRGGIGTVHVAALHAGSGAARLLSAPERAELEDVINQRRPVAMKGFAVLEVVAEPTNVHVLLLPNGLPEHAPDWDDSSVPTAHAVTPWDPVTRKLTFSSARPASMQAGDRLIIGDGATGQERVIEALDSTDAVILEVDDVGDVPTAGSPIYSGGPLVQPARAAILALIDSLGTANPDGRRYGAWEGNLRPTAIGRVASAIAGVLDVDVITPAATVEASDDTSGTTVGLITPGQILVRYKH